MYLVFGIQKLSKWHDDHPVFKGLQLVAAAGVSFGHGANDAQKTMGVIAALLLSAGYTEIGADGKTVEVPEWAALSAYGAIALGTLWGGWKIIETMGLKITTLHANSGPRRQRRCHHGHLRRHRRRHADLDHPRRRLVHRGRGRRVRAGAPTGRSSARWCSPG